MQHPKLNSLSLPFPTDWAALFGTDKPLIVEIGFGNGDYLIALAKAHPDCNIIGFEISNHSVHKAEKKIMRQQLNNALAIYSRAETALHHLFTPQSVRQFHINYPDPWFKSRHSGRRLIQRDTVEALVSRLEPHGLLYLATDIVEYAEMSHEIFAETSGITNLLDVPYVHDFPERLITTKYEQKGYREGRPGHFFKYQRNDQPAPQISVKRELPMPHVIIETPMSPDAIAAQVEKMTYQPGDGITVALLNGYVNPNYGTVLFEAIIEDPTIEQHIALQLTSKQGEANRYTLRAAAFGQPRPTDGMHHAVKFIGEWIADLHDDAAIVHRSLAV